MSNQFPRFEPGPAQLSADDLTRLGDAVSRSSSALGARGMRRSSFTGGEAQTSRPDDFLIIQITAATLGQNAYSFKEVVYTNGAWVPLSGGRVGTGTNLPAIEMSGSFAVPPGTITPGWLTADGLAVAFRFASGNSGFVPGGCACILNQPRQFRINLANPWSDACCGNLFGPPAIPSSFAVNLLGGCQWSVDIAHAPADICVAPPFSQYVNVLMEVLGNIGEAPFCQIRVTFTGVNPNPPATIIFVAIYQTDPATPVGEFLNGITVPLTSLATIGPCNLPPASIGVTPL